MSTEKILREIGLNCTLIVGLADTLNNELGSFLPTQSDNIKIDGVGSVGSSDNEFNNLIEAIAVLNEVKDLAVAIAKVAM